MSAIQRSVSMSDAGRPGEAKQAWIDGATVVAPKMHCPTLHISLSFDGTNRRCQWTMTDFRHCWFQAS